MTQEKIIEYLTNNDVRISTVNYIEVDGTKYKIGVGNTRSYINSNSGRDELQSSLEEPYLSAVMTVWGNTPTMSDQHIEG